MRGIYEVVKQMPRTTDTVRTTGVISAGLGLIAATATPLPRGLNLLAAIGGAAAAGGLAAVVAANLIKTLEENESAKEVDKKIQEFRDIVKPLKRKLEGVKTCEIYTTSADRNDQFQMILQRASGLRESGAIGLTYGVPVLSIIGNLLTHISLRVIATPEKDRELRHSLIQSADESHKAIDELQTIRNKLKDIIEKIREMS